MNRPQLILIINPLGSALAHYTDELEDQLSSIGVEFETIDFPEPSQNGQTRRRWIRQYLSAVRKASRRHDCYTLVTWPALGMLDLVILRVLGIRRGAIVFHDPKPLVRAVGYGKISQLAAALGKRIDKIVHSSAALEDAREHLGMSNATLLPHPVAKSQSPPEPRTSTAIRVLGQYKQSRNLTALRTLAASDIASEYELQIIGRGWPAVEGWSTDDRFVDEDELDRLVRTSSAVLIPYERFYQSGIAVRCLEQGTPFVGPAGTSLEEIVGADSDILVRAEDWVSAVRLAVEMPQQELSELLSTYRSRTRSEYERFFTDALHYQRP